MKNLENKIKLLADNSKVSVKWRVIQKLYGQDCSTQLLLDWAAIYRKKHDQAYPAQLKQFIIKRINKEYIDLGNSQAQFVRDRKFDGGENYG